MPALRSFAALLVCLSGAVSLAAPPALTPQPFVSGLASPVEIANANDGSGRLFVLEQAGRIRVIRNGQLLTTPFLDLSAANGGPVRFGGEQGLLGLAFDPAYGTNGRFYVYYTRALAGDSGGNEIVIERYTRSGTNPDVADPASGSLVLAFAHGTFSNHNGGKLAFGRDGFLYASVGDGGGGGDPFGTGQSLTELRGKILRLDVSGPSGYVVPPSNPFAGNGAARGEIWAYGLRNPWRFSFDRMTGDLFIGDVGQNAWEEIDFEPAGSPGGRNYGWSVFEGTHCFNPSTGCSLAGHALPIIEYGHDSNGGFSVTGGYRYRGGALPALSGYYVYGDFVSGRIWAAQPNASGTWETTPVGSSPNLSAFGEDESGELYVAHLGNGTVMRLTPPATTIPRLANIATRGQVRTGNDVMIAGFVVGGSASKTVAVVAYGPSLSGAGITNALANPAMTLVRAADQAVIATNDDWGSHPNASQLAAAGLAPSNSRESAVLMNLAPGAYTAVVSGIGGGTGVGLVAVYEVDHPEVPLANLSTRGVVLTGNDVMIGGFVVQGSAPRTVVVTGIGPSLASAGIANPLADPTLTLVRQSDNAVMATNDDWQSAPNASQISAAGFAPANAKESAIMMALDPGAYTAILSGVGGTTGVGIAAMYAVP